MSYSRADLYILEFYWTWNYDSCKPFSKHTHKETLETHQTHLHWGESTDIHFKGRERLTECNIYTSLLCLLSWYESWAKSKALLNMSLVFLTTAMSLHQTERLFVKIITISTATILQTCVCVCARVFVSWNLLPGYCLSLKRHLIDVDSHLCVVKKRKRKEISEEIKTIFAHLPSFTTRTHWSPS